MKWRWNDVCGVITETGEGFRDSGTGDESSSAYMSGLARF